MHAYKLKVTIQKDHRVEFRLPDDFPLGPAEIIFLASQEPGIDAREADETFDIPAELEAELLESISEADRGETISAGELIERLGSKL